MNTMISRRHLLASAAALAALPLIPGAARAAAGHELRVVRRSIEVKGRAAGVFGIERAGGGHGLVLDAGEAFRLRLKNDLDEATIVHWHGQTPPPDQDGVSQTLYVDPIAPGGFADYDFAARPGTHWMHSHLGLQEMRLLAAPLIVRRKEEQAADAQEVVVLLHDFAFEDPETLVAGLGAQMGHGMDHGMMDHAAMGHGMPGMGGMDLNDIDFNAFLANDRTLDDPEVVRVERGGRVRLRLINGAAATAFWLDFGGAEASLVAVDGNPVQPLSLKLMPLAQGQRADLLIEVPAGATVPVLAQREGDTIRTGIVLAAQGAAVARIAERAGETAPPADLSVERLLRPLGTSARPVEIRRRVVLGGTMMPYAWTMDGRGWADRIPVAVEAGRRVLVEIVNDSMMAHPMHLHGHHFDVVSIDGVAVQGARRDTVLVPAGATVGIAFDADNAGRWLFHCHNLPHMATGMMTEVVYTPPG
ncbi:multicopper oxidase family protein [Zavarzinia compransoris]|uniref:multicopper oxidase family protein n=1 Tax=Zavarzinia marina TaxID=2911065 RepID=UPI001F254AB7|nr:multicopper oxidase family protein [Zavarzinia marina]MCF4167082.1 multicopper oxidase family protein [Zavarzinia marina]